MCALLIGTFGASLLGNFWGVVPTLNIAVALLLLAGISSFLFLDNVKNQTFSEATAPEAEEVVLAEREHV